MTLLIFDVDGTLVQSTDKADSLCFAGTYKQVYGKPFPTIDWRRYPHVTDTTIFRTVIREHFDREAGHEEMFEFETVYVEALRKNRLARPHHFFEIPGARALVHRLLARPDYLLAIATGGWRRSAHVKMQHVGIPSQALLVSGADGKATREAIIGEVLELAHRIESRFQKIVYVGDAVWDVVTTRNLQMNFVGIRRNNDLETLQKIGATQVLPHFLDQDAFFQAIAKALPPMTEKVGF